MRSLVPCIMMAFACLLPPVLLAQAFEFEHVVIDATNPADPHCKTLGDIDGDGQLDAIAASSSGDGMYWYEYPDWTEHEIRASGSWTTDMQAGDIDNDGDLDLVIPNGSGLQWYENPRPGGDPRVDPWIEHLIGAVGANHHDVQLGLIDANLLLDVVSRDKNGGDTFVWLQTDPTTWTGVPASTTDGEGTTLGDIDGDLDLDIAHNGFWLEQVTPTSWTSHAIDSGWSDVGVVIADINGDRVDDIVLAPSESSGTLSWYETNDPINGPWVEHVIDASVSFLHTFQAADVDGDGDLDLVTAEMHQSSDPDEVSIYVNQGNGLSWSQEVIATTGSHNLRVGDVGADGDLDIFGANWNDSAPNSAVIELWENQSGPLPLDFWRRHVIETNLPWNSVFVDGRDLDGNSLPDLVVGGWWYPNPGSLDGSWTRNTIGAPLHNMAAVHDFDGDGDQDILGTNGQVNGEQFAWADNDGAGNFTIRGITNAATGGDFLQGVSVDQIIAGGETEVALSWHNGANGTSMFTVPADPTAAAWPLAVISATTNEEQIPAGDLDGDLDLDIHLGTDWLRQEPGGTFTTQPGVVLAGGVPDRVVLADIDGDLDLDAVIGIEFSDRLVWAENQGNGTTWVEHEIATDFDYFSVDVADIDGDGDVDVVGGAHQGNGEVSIYENDGTGTLWVAHIVDSGDSSQIDHHDGTRLVDMDLDGDLDVISVGWTLRSLVIYENLAIDGGGGDGTPPAIANVVALGEPTAVLVEFDERVESNSAEEILNYAISDGVAISGADLATNDRVVSLDTSALSPGVSYTLTVDDVEDLAGNTIPPASEFPFEFIQVPPEAGLVGYWPFDAGTGTIAADASGTGRHGILVNGPTWTDGPALDFDGGDDHVDLGDFDLDGTAITLAAWIQPEDLANCSSRDCRILSKATGTAEDDHIFMLSTIASGDETRLRFRLMTGGVTSTLIASSGDLTQGVWTHAAAVYDGATMELFLDGQAVGSTTKSGSVSTAPGVAVWIGGNPPEATGKPWDGLIDEVRIYERALTETEIDNLPPPSLGTLFADGFESGDTSNWSTTVP